LDYKLLSTNCRSVEIDCVSGNERLLNRFGDHTVEEARLAVELLRGIGINVTLHVTIGFPGETIDSMVDTWKFISGNSARISTLSPWPGTEFYEESCRYYEFDFCVNALSWPAFDANRNPGLPWSMNTIKPLDFLEFRSKMKQGVYNGE
jgi:uncharacterized radical SAM superfamily protein